MSIQQESICVYLQQHIEQTDWRRFLTDAEFAFKQKPPDEFVPL